MGPKIVEKLENSKVPVDEAFSLYEKGVELAKKCDEYLKKQEERIKKLGEDK